MIKTSHFKPEQLIECGIQLLSFSARRHGLRFRHHQIVQSQLLGHILLNSTFSTKGIEHSVDPTRLCALIKLAQLLLVVVV